MAEEEKKSVPFYSNPNFWKTMERIGTVVSVGAIIFAPPASLVYQIGVFLSVLIGGNLTNEARSLIVKTKK